MTAVRYIWAFFPNTLIGLLLALLARLTGGKLHLNHGILEAHGGAAAWLLRHAVPLPRGAAAITFGHVVLATDAHALDGARDHELVHVRQYERWGPLYLPAYAATSLWAWAHGRHPYRDNPFEREAYEAGPING